MDSPIKAPGIGLGRTVGLGLALRLLVVWLTARSKSPEWFFSQASELARLADSLANGHGLSSPFGGTTGPSAFLAPGYPAIVAGVFALFHPYTLASEVALMLLQSVFGAATIAALMLLTLRVFGVRAAQIAGLICAVSPPLLWLPVVFWETSLSALLVCLLPALTIYATQRQRMAWWIGLGVAAAVSLLVNPSLATLLLCCFVWAGWPRRGGVKGPVLSALVCVVLFAPWPIRNAITMRTFIPMRSNMGYELWQGNRPGANGFFDAKLHLNQNADEFAQYAVLGEIGYMQRKSELAKAAIFADPLRFARLTVKRIGSFWIGSNPESSMLTILYSCFTLVGGVAGIYLAVKRKARICGILIAPLLVFPIPYYVTHPDFRFRLVVDPILLALCGYALAEWRENKGAILEL